MATPFPNLTTVSGACPTFPDGAKSVPPGTNIFAAPVSIYVGGTGNVVVMPANGGASVTFVGLPAGSMVPCRVLSVVAEGTTAASLVAVY